VFHFDQQLEQCTEARRFSGIFFYSSTPMVLRLARVRAGRSQGVAWCTDGAPPGRSQGGCLVSVMAGSYVLAAQRPRGQVRATSRPFYYLSQKARFMMLVLQGYP